MVHGLKEEDHAKRRDFCMWFNDRKKELPNFIDSLVFSDKGSFYLSGHVNRQNERFWGSEDPHEFVESKSFAPHVNIWLAVTTKHIVGPYFFEEDDVTVTINTARYIKMLKESFLPDLRRQRYTLRDTYFQHDNATPHTANATLDYLESKFQKEKIISKSLWPPRSPDITPLDFFVFGFLKSKVFQNGPTTINELKENIRQEVRNIPASVLKNTFSSLERRVDICYRVDGGHIQPYL